MVWVGGAGGMGCGKKICALRLSTGLVWIRFVHNNVAYTNHRKERKKGGSAAVVKLSSVDRHLVVPVKLCVYSWIC